jgi:hypothetical protein
VRGRTRTWLAPLTCALALSTFPLVYAELEFFCPSSAALNDLRDGVCCDPDRMNRVPCRARLQNARETMARVRGDDDGLLPALRRAGHQLVAVDTAAVDREWRDALFEAADACEDLR